MTVFHTAFQTILVWQCGILSMIHIPTLSSNSNEATFFDFASFQSIFLMAVYLYYVETKSHIFIFAILVSIFSRTVWNAIDDRFSNCVLPLYIETKPHFLIFASFESFFSMVVWNTIDDTYSNFVFYNEAVLYKATKPHFLIFAYFQSIFSMAVWNTIDNRYSNFCIM